MFYIAIHSVFTYRSNGGIWTTVNRMVGGGYYLRDDSFVEFCKTLVV